MANYLGLLLVLVVLVALFSVLSDHFFTLQTLATVANQIPDLTVIAVGMTLVLMIGGIDLSVGSVLALGAAVLGVAMADWHWPVWAAAALCLGAGLACGLANGVISVGWSIPAFIVTLGMLEIARGCAYFATDSQTMYIGADRRDRRPAGRNRDLGGLPGGRGRRRGGPIHSVGDGLRPLYDGHRP